MNFIIHRFENKVYGDSSVSQKYQTHVAMEKNERRPILPRDFLNNVISMYSYRLNENRTLVLCLVTWTAAQNSSDLNRKWNLQQTPVWEYTLTVCPNG